MMFYLKMMNKQQNVNELISFHALPKGVDFMPMGPVTMMRNQLELSGGTKGHYESEEWAKSVDFWQQYVVLETNN